MSDDRHPIEKMMADILGLIPTVDDDGNATGTVSGKTPEEVFRGLGKLEFGTDRGDPRIDTPEYE